MSVKPILFSTEMVKAILSGSKTETRRPIKWKPYHDEEKINFNSSEMSLGHYCTGAPESGYVLYSKSGSCWNQRTKPVHPPYQKGDILWVRETWAGNGYIDGKRLFVYKADLDECGRVNLENIDETDIKWKSLIFMPREAARIFLRVTDVRVERLNQITAQDVRAEGIVEADDYEAVRKFADLWNSINYKRGFGWGTNPWVWVIQFERVHGLADTMALTSV